MKPVMQIHQVEITSRCNLRCRYCAHPKMPRPKMDMTVEIYAQVLQQVKRLYDVGLQRELNIAGIGESTIHPEFAKLLHMTREVLPDIELTLATNGVAMTEDIAQELADARVKCFVSLHRPEKAGIAIEMLKRHGILHGVSADPSIAAVNWAGQVNWHNSAQPTRCMWQAKAMCIVWSDGRVGTCSFDGIGDDGVIGNIYDDISTWKIKPYSLCKTCHQTIGD